MNRIKNLIQAGFESSSSKTPEFIAFSKLFKKAIVKELAAVGAKLTTYSVGHFYVSGFFRVGEKCFYFSLSDVRYFPENKLLYRTAKDEKDYDGGVNQYVQIEDGLVYNMRL